MMDESQPELRWAPLPPQPKRAGRVWLIVGLSVAALAIVGLLLFFLLPRGDSASPSPSASPSASRTPTPSISASPSGSPTQVPSSEPDPEETPRTTPPPVTDPAPEVFREKVSGWLNDAPRGLDIIADVNGRDALPVVDTLQQDAQRLSDAQPPESLAEKWNAAVDTYAGRLSELRSAIENDSELAGAVDAARAAAQELRSLVGL